MEREGYRAPGWSASGYLKIFEGSYGDGETRILAQEPVQNAKDARSGDKVVRVEYRLMQRIASDGKPFNMLTVTDSGTTGLCGNTNPSTDALDRATDSDREFLKWYHFERLFDSNKTQLQNGSRGWGKTIFLKCSCIPFMRSSAMMIYDSLLEDREYRLSDMTIWDDDFGVVKQPLLDDRARRALSDPYYTTPDGNISIPLALKPLTEPGTRIIVPFFTKCAANALQNGMLARWLQYLWWRPIAQGSLIISIVDEVTGRSEIVAEPEWWADEVWSSDATKPGPIHKLFDGCHLQVIEDARLGSGCRLKRLALLYDAGIRDQHLPDNGPNYCGVQMIRSGQCIETYWDSNRIPQNEKPGFRAFVEFDEGTDRSLRDIDITSHDRFRRYGIVKDPILPYLRDRLDEFAENIGLIKGQSRDVANANERFRRTSEFVFDRLLSRTLGNVAGNENGDNVSGEPDRPWDIDVLLSYPNPTTTRANWGEPLSDIRYVVNSRPDQPRRNTQFALEWQAPGQKPEKEWSRKPLRDIDCFRFPDRVLTRHSVDEPHFICPTPGVYRLRALVYEGQKMVAKKSRRIHVEMDPLIREEKPYAVSISVENDTSPGELRIEDGDILRLQINGRNRTHEDVSGTLLLRMREGTLLVTDLPFFMPGKPLGGDDSRHSLHNFRLRAVQGEPGESECTDGILTVALEPGRRVVQAYLLDDNEEIAHGSRTLHFESEPPQSQGGLPFELVQDYSRMLPMWELRLDKNELHFPANYPLRTSTIQHAVSESFDGHDPFELEINVNGLLQWALEPLLEDEADSTRLESLRDASPDLVDDVAWDQYMACLAALEDEMNNFRAEQAISPIEFALTWRKTVAAIYPVLIPEEHD